MSLDDVPPIVVDELSGAEANPSGPASLSTLPLLPSLLDPRGRLQGRNRFGRPCDARDQRRAAA